MTLAKDDRNKIARLRKASAFMLQLHRQVCDEQGDHPDEVDTAYSLACDALHFQASHLAKGGEA